MENSNDTEKTTIFNPGQIVYAVNGVRWDGTGGKFEARLITGVLWKRKGKENILKGYEVSGLTNGFYSPENVYASMDEAVKAIDDDCVKLLANPEETKKRKELQKKNKSGFLDALLFAIEKNVCEECDCPDCVEKREKQKGDDVESDAAPTEKPESQGE